MNQIIGICLSQFHDDPDTFEMLLSYADGREIGHTLARKDAEQIAAEFLTEVDAFAPKDAEISRLTAENAELRSGEYLVKVIEERERLRVCISDAALRTAIHNGLIDGARLESDLNTEFDRTVDAIFDSVRAALNGGGNEGK